jgi:hypothetical protein
VNAYTHTRRHLVPFDTRVMYMPYVIRGTKPGEPVKIVETAVMATPFPPEMDSFLGWYNRVGSKPWFWDQEVEASPQARR